MSNSQLNTIKLLLEEPNRKKFVETIFKERVIDFKTLYSEKLEISETNARYHLKQLVDNEIVEKIKQKGSKAIYLILNPLNIERIRVLLNETRKYVYFGLIGRDTPVEQFNSTIEKLKAENYEIIDFRVFGGSDAINEFQKNKEMSSIYVSLLDLFNFEQTLIDIEEQIKEKIKGHSIIADVTGSTKIHTIALYNLAVLYGLKKIYNPKGEGKLIFL